MPNRCLDADIKINPVGAPVKVYLDGALITQSSNALALHEASYPVRYYVPRADIKAEMLAPSDHTTYCPYKGDASYHHLDAGGELVENAVWYYPDPCPLVEQVRDHLSFWGDRVKIVPAA